MNACAARRTSLALLVWSALQFGCAFTDVPLTMPTRGVESTVPGGRGREVIVVKPFADERRIRDRCGMQKNGYNMDTADAKCTSDPAAWIAQYLADEMRASGFRVLAPEEPHRPGAVRVEGALLKLFVEPVIGAWTGSLEADLSARLVVRSDTGLEAERTFFVKGVKKGVVASTVTPFNTSMSRAAQEIAAQMVKALVELMDRYPQLGAAPEGTPVPLAGWQIRS